MDMRAYPCEYCGGWHKTRRKLTDSSSAVSDKEKV